MQKYMVYNIKDGSYSGPFDFQRATREAKELAEKHRCTVEVMPLGRPVHTAKWVGLVIEDSTWGK